MWVILLALALCRTKPLAQKCVMFGLFLCHWYIAVKSPAVERQMRNEEGEEGEEEEEEEEAEKEEVGRKAGQVGRDLN